MMAAVADLAAWEEPAAAVRAVVKTAAEVAATAAGSTVPLLNSAIQAADGWRCSPSFIVLTTTPCGIAAISSTVEPCTGTVACLFCTCTVGRTVGSVGRSRPRMPVTSCGRRRTNQGIMERRTRTHTTTPDPVCMFSKREVGALDHTLRNKQSRTSTAQRVTHGASRHAVDVSI